MTDDKFMMVDSNLEVLPSTVGLNKEPTLDIKCKDPVSDIDDGVITVAIANVDVMQATDMLIKTSVSNKRVKVTQIMIESAYKKLRIIVANKEVTVDTATVIVAYAMQISNEMLNTSKTYKVELALAIIRKLIDDEVCDPGHRAVIHMIVETSVSHFMKTIEGLPSLWSRLVKCCKK
jgi:hypothetical protein